MSESPEQQESAAPAGGMKAFSVIWLGQLVSLLGSSLTNFAIGIWVLQQTGSVTSFTLIAVIAGLPGVIFSPLAGALVDRWDRRTVLILSDLGAGLATATLALLIYNDALVTWHIYVVVAVSSLCNTFQWPAYIASITVLVDEKHYGRVQGMIQFGQAGTTIVAPALAAGLLLMVGLWGVILIDFATFLVAVVALLMVSIPKPEVSDEGEEASGSLFKEAMYGWHYIKARPGLMGLLIYFAAINFVTSLCGIALVPMALRLSSELDAGLVLSSIGIGMLLGSTYLTITGGPKKRIHGVLGFGMAFSLFIFLAGLTPSIIVVCVAALLWHANIPIINGSSAAIWQSKVAPDVQGRVFAMRRMIAMFTVPLGDFSAGPLSDYVFEPLMAKDGALAHTLGPVMGTGPGRGIGLMLVTFSIFPFLIAVWGYFNPRIRNIEEELPDFRRKAREEDAGDEAAESTAAGDTEAAAASD